MSAPKIPIKADFRTPAKTHEVPIARLIGFEANEITDGRAVVTLLAGPQHANPMGTLHGGILCDIADAAMGMAFASTLAPEESFTTVELKINFFRPVWEAHLKAQGKVVRRGRSIGYVECEITDEHGQLVAKAASTCLALRGEDAKGAELKSQSNMRVETVTPTHSTLFPRSSNVLACSQLAAELAANCTEWA